MEATFTRARSVIWRTVAASYPTSANTCPAPRISFLLASSFFIFAFLYLTTRFQRMFASVGARGEARKSGSYGRGSVTESEPWAFRTATARERYRGHQGRRATGGM